MLVLTGGVDVELDNNSEQKTVRLTMGDRALRIHAGVWLRLKALSRGQCCS